MKLFLIVLFLSPFSLLFSEEKVFNLQSEIEYSWYSVQSELKGFKNVEWKRPDKKNVKLFSNQKTKHLLLKIKLPNLNLKDPVLYLQTVYQNFEIYYSKNKLYQFGVVGGEYWGSPIHLIEFPKNEDRYFYMRISSDISRVGIKEDIVFGEGKDLILYILKKDIERFVSGILYIFIGMFSSILYFRRKLKEYLAFGLLALCIGFFYISSRATGIQQLLIYSAFNWMYIAVVSLNSIPVFVFWLLYILVQNTKKLILLLLRIHIIFDIYIILMLFFFPPYQNLIYFYILSSASIFIGFLCLSYETTKKNMEARILLIALGINFLAGIHDIMRNFSLLPYDLVIGSKAFFIFIMSIVYLLEKRFSETHKKLELYSRELEYAKNTLEETVENRTRKLKDSYEEIKQLKYAQDGDYFLTSLIIKPLAKLNINSKRVKVSFFTRQKKQFEFNRKSHRIGGDISIADEIELGGKKFIVFVNGDAMGKSLQGAGGALVFGSVFRSIITQTKSLNTTNISPKSWLIDAVSKLQTIFESFDCSMLISIGFGLIEEKSGMVYYLNAEHPWTVLYRDGKAGYIEDENTTSLKIGFPSSFMQGEVYYIQTLQLKKSDILILGSDGRDDIDESYGREYRINSDPLLFLKAVEEGRGELKYIYKSIVSRGSLVDDISLIKIKYL